MENIDTRGLANGATREATKRIRDLKHGMEEVAGRVAEETEAVLEQARERGEEAIEQIYDQGKKTVSLLSKKIKKDPVTSVAIAAGVGVLLGMLVRRYGSSSS